MNPISQLPKYAEITDVGLRDGLQTRQVVPVDKKLELIQNLIRAGVKKLQVTSFVHPKRVPQMADAEELCGRLPHAPEIEFSALVLNIKGVERAIKTNIDALDMGVAVTETLSRRNANCTVAEGMAQMAQMVTLAHEASLRVRGGLHTVFGCAYEGHVPQQRVLELCEQTLEMGVDELTLADSTGMANPRQVETLLEALRPLAGDVPITLHLHDTRGLGLANVYAALRGGVTRFDTSFGGLGGCPFIEGAKGNIATEDTVNLLHEVGVETRIDIARIAEVSRDMEAFLQTSLPAKLHHLLAPVCVEA